MADSEGDQRRHPWAGDIRKDAANETDRLRSLAGTRPSIRFWDKERGLRGVVKLLFDASRVRQKV